MNTPRFCLERRCQVGCLKSTGANMALHGSQAFSDVKPADRRPLPRGPSGSIGVAAVGLDRDDRSILEQIFAASDEFHSCGCFPGAAAARLAIAKCEPRLLLMALALPDLCGIRCARELLASQPGLDIILVTAIRDPVLLRRAVAVGIADLLVQPFTLGRCLARMRFALCRSFRGHWPYLDGPEAGRPSSVNPQPQLAHPLRDLERTVLDFLAEGLMYKEIGDRIGRSEAAVRKLVNSIYQKIHTHTRAEAVIKYRHFTG